MNQRDEWERVAFTPQWKRSPVRFEKSPEQIAKDIRFEHAYHASEEAINVAIVIVRRIFELPTSGYLIGVSEISLAGIIATAIDTYRKSATVHECE